MVPVLTLSLSSSSVAHLVFNSFAFHRERLRTDNEIRTYLIDPSIVSVGAAWFSSSVFFCEAVHWRSACLFFLKSAYEARRSVSWLLPPLAPFLFGAFVRIRTSFNCASGIDFITFSLAHRFSGLLSPSAVLSFIHLWLGVIPVSVHFLGMMNAAVGPTVKLIDSAYDSSVMDTSLIAHPHLCVSSLSIAYYHHHRCCDR